MSKSMIREALTAKLFTNKEMKVYNLLNAFAKSGLEVYFTAGKYMQDFPTFIKKDETLGNTYKCYDEKSGIESGIVFSLEDIKEISRSGHYCSIKLKLK